MADEKNKQAVSADKKAPAKKEKATWKVIGKRLLPIASVVALLVGLLTVAYCFYPAVNTAFAANVGMQVVCVLAGVCLVAGGVLGLLKKSKNGQMTLAVSALVLSLIVLTATAASGAYAIIVGILGILASVFSIIAVDGYFDAGLVRYFREMFGELKKLTWLSGKDLVSHTSAVLVFVLAMALIIYVLDLVFSTGFSALSKLNIG